MDEREQKGLVIAATARIQKQGDAWLVPAQTGRGDYTVRLTKTGGNCTCPDFELRQKRCKHLYAVELVVKRETSPDGTVTETRAVRLTYAQDWPAYNAAQTTEKEHFCKLLRELVADVPTPPQQGAGNRRLPLSEVLFACAYKVYTGFSGRRFMTDLRQAQSAGLIDHAPHYNCLFEAMESEEMTPILHQLIERASLPLREVEMDFAADSTGFGTSNFFRYYSVRYEGKVEKRAWIKTHIMTGVRTNVITAVNIGGMNDNDSLHFRALVDATYRNFTMREVSADKAYSSRYNLAMVTSTGATPFIPFKSNAQLAVKNAPYSAIWNRLYHYFALNRDDFAAHYHKRSNVESTFSMVKRVFGANVRSKTETAQKNEVLLKLLCHNIRVLIHEMHELGIEPMLSTPATAC